MTDSLSTARQHLRLVDYATRGVSTSSIIEEARALERLGRRGDARAKYERALQSLTEPSPALASMLLRWIARTHEGDADFAAADDCAQAAVAAAEVSDDRNALGHALNVLAVVRWRRGSLDEANRLFREALDRGTTAAEPRLQVDVMTNMGTMASIRGDFREALHYFQDALATGRQHSLLDNIVAALNNLGLTNMALGRHDAAEECFAEALAIADALGGLSSRVELEVNIATLQLERRNFEAAQQRCDRAMALAEHLDDSRANGEVSRVCGVIAREAGDFVGAERHFTLARDVAAAGSDLALEGTVNRELAELYVRQGRNRETLQSLNRAHACFTHLRSRHELADVGRRMARLEGDFLEVVRKWSESIESKDHHTQGHCERVADLSVALAARTGLDETSLFWFRIGALLHDVGKLIVPAEILNKPDKLTDDEWALVRQHPAAGERLLADVQFPWDVAPMVRSHHERWDGQGYPDALRGEEIPLAARILCVADVYDALTTERSYKRAFSQMEALEIMRREIGRQFDPGLFGHFEELVRRGSVPAPTRAREGAQDVKAGVQPRVTVAEDDDLTGALLRRAFVSVTSAVLVERRRVKTPVSLLVIDIDQFKQVNDTFGHLTGDDALRLVANEIRGQLRPGQYIGRYAGDEFVVLLPGADAQDAYNIADGLRRVAGAMRVPLREEPDRHMSVTLSIGVATAPEHGETFEELFSTADRALFDAKRLGRDKVVAAGGGGDSVPQLVFHRFVGRANELRTLVSALDDSVHGAPQARILIGEAGVGKSSLVRQLLPELRLRGAIAVTGRALESESRVPFGPWTEIISALHAQGMVPARAWSALGRLVPELRAPGTRTSNPASEILSGNLVSQELVALFRGVSEARPLLLVLEDMQWSDSSSWDALEYILAQTTSERICIAVTIRAEEAALGSVRERRQRLTRDERVREFTVERLSASEVSEWLRGALHRTDPCADLIDYVIRHTEGNAFLVAQLLRTMMEENVFRHEEGRWQWRIPASLSLPAGMTDLVGRRLSRLTLGAAKILVTAAALGRTFTLSMLTEASGADADAVLDAVDAGLEASVLETTTQNDDVYQFAHVLLVDAMLKSVSPARRRVTHERIARILVAADADDISRIATHFANSGSSGEAYAWGMRAAARAMSLYSLDEAVGMLELALSHAATDDERAEVHAQLARAAEHSGRWGDVERSCDAILATSDATSDHARALPVRLRRLQARVRLGQAAEDTRAECHTLLEVATRVGRIADVVQARSLLVQILGRAGDADGATRVAVESLAIARHAGDEAVYDEALHRLAITQLDSQLDQAIAHLLELIERARQRGDKATEARAYLSLGVARMRQSDESAATGAFRSALVIAREASALDLAATASMNLGVLQLRAGEHVASRSALSDALRLYTTLRNNTYRTAALYNLANLEREAGDATAALALYREVATIARSLGADDIAIGAYAGVGLAALRLADPASARGALESARTVMGDRDEWWFQGRELLESLSIRTTAIGGDRENAAARFATAVARLETIDPYAAAWLVCDSAAELAEGSDALWPIVERLGRDATIQQFAPLCARFTALRDVAERLEVTRRRSAGPPREAVGA